MLSKLFQVVHNAVFVPAIFETAICHIDNFFSQPILLRLENNVSDLSKISKAAGWG